MLALMSLSLSKLILLRKPLSLSLSLTLSLSVSLSLFPGRSIFPCIFAGYCVTGQMSSSIILTMFHYLAK